MNFADQIARKSGEIVSIPGNHPYKKGGGAGLLPKPTKGCVKCGLCAKRCPGPHNARKVNGAMVSVAALAIKKAPFYQFSESIILSDEYRNLSMQCAGRLCSRSAGKNEDKLSNCRSRSQLS